MAPSILFVPLAHPFGFICPHSSVQYLASDTPEPSHEKPSLVASQATPYAFLHPLSISIIPLSDKEIFRLTPVSHSSIMRLDFVIEKPGKIVAVLVSRFNENAEKTATTSMYAARSAKRQRD
jgi:hypothetical protein